MQNIFSPTSDAFEMNNNLFDAISLVPTKEQNDENLKNTKNFVKDQLIVSYDKNDKYIGKYIIYDSHDTLLGSFTILDIIKYLASQWKFSNINFLEDVDTGLSFDIITGLLLTAYIDTDIGRIDIKLKSHLESPIMGNVEILIKISNDLNEYEKVRLSFDLEKIDDKKIRKKILMTIKHFIHVLLNHILHVIYAITEEIKNDPQKKDLADKLLKYSMGITYRISCFVKDHLETQIDHMKNLSINVSKLLDVKQILLDKLKSLEESNTNNKNALSKISSVDFSELTSSNNSSSIYQKSEKTKKINTNSSTYSGEQKNSLSSYFDEDSDDNGYFSDNENDTKSSKIDLSDNSRSDTHESQLSIESGIINYEII